jgi:uncharacterized protein (TIGR02246 family)
MKRVFKLSMVALGLILSVGILQSCSKDKDENASSNDRPAIEALIKSYQEALNASDANKVVSLFTTSGVLMANAAPTAEGAAAVKATYQYVFDNFTYTLQFSVIEINIASNTAFARSTSKGSFVIKSTGQTVADENRESFVFEKVDGKWSIARYMYNKTK